MSLKEKLEEVKKMDLGFNFEKFFNECLDGYDDELIEYFLDKLIANSYEYYSSYKDFLDDVYLGDNYDIIQEVIEFMNKNKVMVIDNVEQFCKEYFTDCVFMDFEDGLIVIKEF